MKRIPALLLLLVAGIVAPGVVRAAVPHAKSIEFGKFVALRHAPLSASRLSILPDSLVAHAYPLTTPAPGPTPTSLLVPASAFTPATVQSSGEANNTAAKATLLAVFHNQTYDALGRTDGTLQTASAPVTGGSSGATLTAQYLSSIYPSSAGASAAFTDEHANLTGGGVTPEDCSSTGVQCEAAAFSVMTSQNGTLGFDLLYEQVGVCTAEITVTGALSDIQVDAQTAATIASNVATAATTVLTAACLAAPSTPGPGTPTVTVTPTATPAGPPTIKLTGLALVHTVKGSLKSTKSIKVKEPVTFLAAYTATNAGSLTATGTLKVTEGKKSLGSDSMTAGIASDGTTYFYDSVKFRAKTPLGKVKAHITVTLGTATDTRTLTFKLHK